MNRELSQLYRLNKAEVTKALQKAREDTNGTFDELRACLRRNITRSDMTKDNEARPPPTTAGDNEGTTPPITTAMDRVRKWG